MDQHSFESEYILENWLHSNSDVILEEPILIFGRQYGIDTGIPDLLALDQWGNVIILELKRGKSGTGSASEATILSQPQNYAQSLSNYSYKQLDEIYQQYKQDLRNDEWNLGNIWFLFKR